MADPIDAIAFVATGKKTDPGFDRAHVRMPRVDPTVHNRNQDAVACSIGERRVRQSKTTGGRQRADSTG